MPVYSLLLRGASFFSGAAGRNKHLYAHTSKGALSRRTDPFACAARRGVPTASPAMLSPPPWAFPNARVWYQPTFVPVQAARAVTPTSGLTLLSLFSWTLGGVFVVEWEDSPIGPYQEVAVLSGLVARGLSIGAWASHIVVTTDDAVVSGRSVFGLPARQGSIDFGGSIFDVVPSSPSPRAEAAEAVWGAAATLAVLLKTAVGAAVPGVAEPAERLRRPPRARPFEGVEFRADNEVGVCGWDGWLTCATTGARSKAGRSACRASLACYPRPRGRARRCCATLSRWARRGVCGCGPLCARAPPPARC